MTKETQPSRPAARKPRRLSERYFFNSAVYYLQRYAATEAHLKHILQRKILRATQRGDDIPPDSALWIDQAVQKCVALGYVNDRVYTESRINALRREGRATRFIRRTLESKGVPRDLLDDMLQESDTDHDMAAAQRYIKRRRLGRSQDREAVQKDWAKLVRAGFSLDVARKALAQSVTPEEEA